MKKSDAPSGQAVLKRAQEELRQRTAELEIINRVQLGLAAQRHVQDIYDLIGDKIREIFNAQVVMISIYDPQTDQVAHRYAIERGKRVYIAEPQPVGGFRRHIIESGESLLVNTNVAEKAAALGQPTLPGTETPRSWLGVPMLVGKRVTGVMSLQNLDQENAFTESDLRLLQTLASSMSVAIENARLFDETQRLLKETEQRAAELAIINSVQATLASKLDLHEIYETVGDKIRENFHNTDVSIRIYDPKTGLLHLPYNYDNGQRIVIDSLPLAERGFSAHVIHTGETIVMNDNVPQMTEQYGSYVLPGEHPPKSSVFVPLTIGGQTRGLIRLKNLERENAFSESDVRLLQTLANAMSVALENARLFAETKQRAAELAIINSVQEGLASKLDLQAIYDLVGDKIRDIFDAQGVLITSFNHEKKLSYNHYSIEKGKRVHLAPTAFTRGTEYLFRARQPVLVNRNYDEWFAKEIGGERRIIPGTEPSKCAVWVPLIVGDTVTGMISLHNVDRENAFTDSDVRLLSTLANAMSVALENARLFDETERLLKETEQRAVELTTVNRVSHALASQVDLASLIQLAGTQIRDTFNADIAYIALLDAARRWIQFPYTFGETFTPIEFGEGLTSKIIETREALLINRDMEIRRAQIGATQVGIDVKSYLGVPILVGTQAIGVVSVQSIHHEGRFDEDDQHLLMTIAANVGVAIERARHYASEQRRAEQFRVINEVSHGITSILDVERLLDEIVRDIQSAFGYYVVGISLIERDELVVKAIVPRQLQTLATPPLQLKVGQEGVMGWVAGAGEPLLVPDTSQEPRFVLWPPDARTRSELAVPLKTQAGVIGVLNVESDQLNAFDHSDLTVLQSLANQIAIAIENAQLFQTEKRRAEQFQIIAEIGRNITSLLDTNQIMQQVTQSLRQAFDYYHVGIGLIEGDQVVYRVGSGKLWDDSTFTFKPQRLRIGEEGLTGWVAAHGEPVIIPDVTQDPRYVLMQGSATRSELIAPIIVKEQIIGVLDVQSDQLEAFDNTDLAVVQSIANQIGTAIENARLYERAQELAVMQERNRLARDLHDAVTQTLFSASLIADALPPTWDSDPNQGRLLLRELRQLSRGALAEMRTLLLELRPAALVETPLGNLLRQLGEAMAGREGLLVTVNAAKDCKLPAEAHIAFYRIAQEALNNILKHSRATNVVVSLYFRTIDNRPRIEMSISDNGRGFDMAHVAPDHFGLRNMRERAQAIGAEFSVTSQPGDGTQIQVTWENQEVVP